MSAMPKAMTLEKLVPHKLALHRQTIGLYKKQGFFPGLPRRQRWRECFHLVVDAWLSLGPQRDGFSEPVICLPDGGGVK